MSPLFGPSRSVALPAVARGPTPTRQPTRTPGPTAVGTGAAAATRGGTITELVIYDEILDPDWSADDSWGVKVDLADRSHVYTGTVAAAITPLEDYGAIFLAVKQGANRTFPIAEVLGVSLWINSGNDILTPDDLAVTVIGSNDYTYWVKNDPSVQLDDLRFFSESRLNYLGITRSLAPDKWAEAIIRLDKLPYDPNYKYVTGVYVKNDKDFRQTFYIDRVALLLVQP